MSLLYVENLSVSFDGFKAVDIKNFQLEENELRTVIGPNGAGKTTFLDLICGKTQPSTGKILLNQKEIVDFTEKQRVDAGIGRKFQAPSIFGSLTVLENLQLAIKTDKAVWSTFFHKNSPEQNQRIMEVAVQTGFKDNLKIMAGSLSHGQKQWLEIAMVILQDPVLLLIDEPAAGMTDEETEKTGHLLVELAKDRSIIVIEHDMTFVRQIARTVTVLHEGRVLVEGPMDVVQNDERVIECYLGSAQKKEAK